MNPYQAIAGPVGTVFLTILIGILLRRTGLIAPTLDQGLTRLIINLFFPALLFSKIAGNPALDQPADLIWAPLIGFACVSTGYLVCYFAAPLFGIRKRDTRGAFCLTTGNFNYGFIPIPIALSLFDERTIGILFLHNVGVEIALWTIGLTLLTGTFNRAIFKKLVNAPMITILVSMAVHFSGLLPHVPRVIFSAADSLGQCAIPISLLMIGMTIGNHLTTHPRWDSLRIAIPACLLRLAFLPAFMFALAIYLPVSIELKRVLVLQAAMPSAVFPILLASHYHRDPQTALRVVLSTSTLAIITLPLWLANGLRIIGSS